MLTEPRLLNPRRLEWRLNLPTNFTLEELVHSDYALRHDIDNSTDDTNIIAALTARLQQILDLNQLILELLQNTGSPTDSGRSRRPLRIPAIRALRRAENRA